MSRGLPFEPGNKFGRGRPKGSRNKSTIPASNRLLAEYAQPLMQKNIAEGLQTNTKSRLWSLDKLAKQRRLPKLKLPPIKTLDDVIEACAKVVAAVANRKYPAVDGQILMSLLDNMKKMIEIRDLEQRIQELEQRVKGS